MFSIISTNEHPPQEKKLYPIFLIMKSPTVFKYLAFHYNQESHCQRCQRELHYSPKIVSKYFCTYRMIFRILGRWYSFWKQEVRHCNEINTNGSFRLCNWVFLRRLVSWINHLPFACWSTFWKSIFNTSWAVGLTYWIVYLHFFCILTYASIFVLIHYIIFGFIFTS